MYSNKVYTKASFYAYIVNGFLLLLAIILLYTNYDEIKKINSLQLIKLILLFSIAIGSHSLLHLGFEYIYEWNPIDNIRVNAMESRDANRRNP